mmetsp:Transcript_27954/g.58536  ORF Transcript_27954/g.58536 Transcript_27954/m.58536 type:complete len:240 (+) Transcript_27954:1374-2093(+)
MVGESDVRMVGTGDGGRLVETEEAAVEANSVRAMVAVVVAAVRKLVCRVLGMTASCNSFSFSCGDEGGDEIFRGEGDRCIAVGKVRAICSVSCAFRACTISSCKDCTAVRHFSSTLCNSSCVLSNIYVSSWILASVSCKAKNKASACSCKSATRSSMLPARKRTALACRRSAVMSRTCCPKGVDMREGRRACCDGRGAAVVTEDLRKSVGSAVSPPSVNRVLGDEDRDNRRRVSGTGGG